MFCVPIIVNNEVHETQASNAPASFRTLKDNLEAECPSVEDSDPLYLAAIRAARAPKSQVPTSRTKPNGVLPA